MDSFISGDLTKDVMTIEHELGVTRVGRRSEFGMDGMWPGFRFEDQEDLSQLLDRPKAMQLTVRINTQYTRVLFSKRSPAWSQDASKFLLGMPEILPSNDGWGSHDDHQLMELLQYNIDVAKSIEDHVTNLQSRMELQLNVVR
jgi:glutamate-1-semialdehyde 2,1-aminomutase